MKKKPYDYSKLSLSTITSPEYRHLLLLLGWVWYFAMYFLTERLIPESRCHVIHCVVDDWIPFVEYFVLAYVFWYFLIVSTLLYFLLYDVDRFRRLQIFIITTQVVAVIIYILWPSVQYLRPEEFVRDNLCTRILSVIYSADTPTGVLPSLHVGYSLGIASAWVKKKDARVSVRVFVVVAVVLICMSVNFVKQHSFLDVVAAIPVCLLAELIAFGKSYWLPKWKNKRGT